MGPSHYKPGNSYHGEGKVIDNTARFPKPDGIGEEGAKGTKWRLGEVQVTASEEEAAWDKDTPLLLIVKYFV